jgi:hypothetical protein
MSGEPLPTRLIALALLFSIGSTFAAAMYDLKKHSPAFAIDSAPRRNNLRSRR